MRKGGKKISIDQVTNLNECYKYALANYLPADDIEALLFDHATDFHNLLIGCIFKNHKDGQQSFTLSLNTCQARAMVLFWNIIPPFEHPYWQTIIREQVTKSHKAVLAAEHLQMSKK
jgi:hypothetical protein